MMERRQSKRLDYRTRVEIKFYSVAGRPELAGTTLECEAADVSEGGVRFISGTDIPPRTQVKLRIVISDPPSAFSHAGEVRWSHGRDGNASFEIGVQFMGSEDHLSEWRRVVAHIAELTAASGEGADG